MCAFKPLLPLLLSLLLYSLSWLCRAEEPNPLAGNIGIAPPEYPTKVYVSAMLDRIMSVDEKLYEFDVVMYIFMSWRDPRAKDAIALATAQQAEETYNGGDGCARLCAHTELPYSNGAQNMSCCDSIWLPGVSCRNVISFPEDRTAFWKSIDLSTDGESVVWRNVVRGIYYASLDYRDFPFDSQTLSIIMAYLSHRPDEVEFIPSWQETAIYEVGSGDATSGWNVDQIKVRPYEVVAEAVLPFVPANTINESIDEADGRKNYNAYIYRVDIEIHVTRISSFFVTNLIVPIVFTTVLGFTAFFIDSNDIGTRVGVIVTLLLALITTQFSINDTLPSSSYLLPTQILILTSYGFLLVICLESIVVRYITEYPELARQEAARQAGRDRLKRMKHAIPALCHTPDHLPLRQASSTSKNSGGLVGHLNPRNVYFRMKGLSKKMVPGLGQNSSREFEEVIDVQQMSPKLEGMRSLSDLHPEEQKKLLRMLGQLTSKGTNQGMGPSYSAPKLAAPTFTEQSANRSEMAGSSVAAAPASGDMPGEQPSMAGVQHTRSRFYSADIGSHGLESLKSIMIEADTEMLNKDEDEDEEEDMKELLKKLAKLRKNFWFEVLYDKAIATYIGSVIDMWTLCILMPLYITVVILIFTV